MRYPHTLTHAWPRQCNHLSRRSHTIFSHTQARTVEYTRFTLGSTHAPRDPQAGPRPRRWLAGGLRQFHAPVASSWCAIAAGIGRDLKCGLLQQPKPELLGCELRGQVWAAGGCSGRERRDKCVELVRLLQVAGQSCPLFPDPRAPRFSLRNGSGSCRGGGRIHLF